MFGLFKSVVNLAGDVVEIVGTPVEMAVDLASAVVQPIAEAAKELKADVKSLKD